MLGKNIDRFQIVEQLGEGGMATVFKARDERLDRDVAIKVIRKDAFPPNILDKILRRFEREAKSLAKLAHPNIVSVIDYGDFEGSPYIVMEYLSGGTLKDKLKMPMPWRNAIQLLLPISRALEFAHEQKIIHRDIKPSNILLTEKDYPKLTDFGVAKMLGTEENLTMNGTDTGIGLGTPDYMAPEQWNGETTPQSDVYSLGVVFYEMLTARKPYSADTPAAILLKQATEPLPNPRQYAPDLPEKVVLFLMRALASSPVNRFQNMSVLSEELTKLMDESVDRPTPKSETSTTEHIEIPQALGHNSLAHARVKEIVIEPVPGKDAPKKRSRTLGFIIGGFALAFAVCALGIFGMSKLLGFSDEETASTSTKEIAASQTTESTPEPSLQLSTATLDPTESSPASGLEEQIVDDRGVSMQLVPAGEFIMGSDNSEVDSKPEFTYELPDYYIDKYEVTNVLYTACVADGTCKQPRRFGSATLGSYYDDPRYENYPVIFVDWNMASTYCGWRNARLPTEAEWEKAARGTDGNVYPWGGSLACQFANYSGCVGDTTSIVTYDTGVSDYGVYDMSGNVIEWTSTLFRLYPYSEKDGREDPALSGFRVARGGSWTLFNGNASVRTDTRFKIDASYYGLYVGFRCAKDAP